MRNEMPKPSVSQQITGWKALVESELAEPSGRERELVDALRQAIQTVVVYQELIGAADWWDADRVREAFSRAKTRTP